LNEQVLETLRLKYFLKDDEGNLLETEPEHMFARVAKAVALAEEPNNRKYWEGTFYDIMASHTFMPGTPCLMNAGTKIKSLAACFLVDMEDSMGGIMESLSDSAKIFASGGGVGVPFSKLRARGDMVSTTKGTSTGPVSFAQMFDAMVDTVKQGGKRRGAMMMTLSVDHPDILEFIQVKRDKKRLNNMNLSVMLKDDFMRAVENNEDYWAADPRTGIKRGFHLPGGEEGPIAARYIMDLIAEGAWSDGEPGAYFIDNAQAANPFPFEE
jgi:ribonucleoside-diphosphate reductase alpha chain